MWLEEKNNNLIEKQRKGASVFQGESRSKTSKTPDLTELVLKDKIFPKTLTPKGHDE